jgi:hypothetical protein
MVLSFPKRWREAQGPQRDLGRNSSDVRDDLLIQFNVPLRVFSAERLHPHQDLRR